MRLPGSALLFAAALVLSAQQVPDLRKLVAQAPRLPLERTEFVPQPPGPGWAIGYPTAVTMDAKGQIYILQRGSEPNRPPVSGTADPILVFSQQGRLIRSWGKGMFQIPHSIRIDPQGNVWTVDAASSMVYKFNPYGEKLMEIAVGGQPAGKRGFAGTTDIAFAPNGHLYISDGYGNARILEYSPDGKRLREWGSAGTGPGQFNQPHGIAIDEQGIVYVADRHNGRIQRFDLRGKFLGEWNQLGMVTGVTYGKGSLWIGTQRREENTGANGWLMRIDRKSGRILGTMESSHAHHVISVTPRGELLSGARPSTVYWFRTPR
jgi:DNA-binding beta-propeller fold protein YncE